MAFAAPAFFAVIRPSFKSSTHRHLQVRAQTFREEGNIPRSKGVKFLTVWASLNLIDT